MTQDHEILSEFVCQSVLAVRGQIAAASDMAR